MLCPSPEAFSSARKTQIMTSGLSAAALKLSMGDGGTTPATRLTLMVPTYAEIIHPMEMALTGIGSVVTTTL